ncbi:CREB3 regulatory factor [Hippocampus zosterae]|uniref:CREB3 regulatory factor n=1 Tax=Hippocampus zosterae TaxID=109293 RepID=UPI00223DF317|nr:CREB3 regulatory factor [Hippocampus zosterae]XP_051903001.1 CREB3 regulatory factor [Hippocampus zosterae]XP_051903002.1 CREB3 regulatory factor [Hippocampus zosterae]
MPQPSVSGMEPPFGDDFQHFFSAEQALTSTELLANTCDPDFMYELDRDTSQRQSPYAEGPVGAADGAKDGDAEQRLLTGLGEGEAAPGGCAFEQWDSYWEDLTRYTRLASCDIWGTKEVDFLGLDDFSSPYQDEEVIGRTPTLAQLNGEDSQPVCEALYPPSEPGPPGPQPPPPMMTPAKRAPLPASGAGLPRPSVGRASSSRPSDGLLPDFPEGFQKATRPVPSSTDSVAETQARRRPAPEMAADADFASEASARPSAPQVGADGRSRSRLERADAPPRRRESASAPPASRDFEGAPAPEGAGPAAPGSERDAPAPVREEVAEEEKSKEEEHNYSLFLTQSRLAGRSLPRLDEEDEDEDDDDEDEDEEDDEGEEDHDEGFGSERELSDNEDEDEDYEADKDDDMSDAFSEPGRDASRPEEAEGSTSSRKRGKRRYFWEYSEQLTPSKQERLLKPSEWDRRTLPSNLYQKNGPPHGKYALKKSRRTDVEDLTPNPRKLLQIGSELRKLNKVIGDLTPVSELPLTARPWSRKEKNKLASRACRLKKKAQYEANKVKLWGLSTEYDRLLFVINAIKEEIVSRADNPSAGAGGMSDTLDTIMRDKLVSPPIAGQTSDFVNKILENTGSGDPTGGLLGLRVPTSKM